MFCCCLIVPYGVALYRTCYTIVCTVQNGSEACIPKVALQWTPHGKRKLGPKTTWHQTVMAELSEVELTRGEVPHVIQNKDKWGQKGLKAGFY